MGTAMVMLVLLGGALLGALLMHLLKQGRETAALAELRVRHEQDKGELTALLKQREEALALLREQQGRERGEHDLRLQSAARELAQRGEDLVKLSGTLATEQERNRTLNDRLNEQRAELEQLQQRLTTEFENIANRLLSERGKALNEQHQEKLGVLLKPLQDRLNDFQRQVREAYETEGRERHTLKSELMKLVEQNQRLSQEANDLTRALKGDTQAQGAWGEMILEKLLESSGLMKGAEFSMQESTTLGDGTRLRPDAVVMLPDQKHLVIDSKVSLLHYERWAAATDPAEKERLMRLHVESLRAHAKGLSEKDYTKLYDVRSVDFVLMFVPIEPAFLLALRERPELFQEAYDRQVVMVTHTTLMATLRTIHSIWKHERIARNHLEIADRAGKLYEKFAGFSEDLIKVGQQMDSAKKSYSDAMGKLSEGPGNLVRQVEMLKELGAKTNRTVNEKLLQRSLGDQASLLE